MRVPMLAVILCLTTTPAFADIRNEADIRERILVVGEAEALVKGCSRVKERRMVGIQFLMATARMALDRGYSRAEIEAYVDDKAEKERLRAIARERVAAKGAVRGDEASHCRLARAEMARGSDVGRLLR